MADKLRAFIGGASFHSYDCMNDNFANLGDSVCRDEFTGMNTAGLEVYR